jgi:GT2 family glycosyltransferase
MSSTAVHAAVIHWRTPVLTRRCAFSIIDQLQGSTSIQLQLTIVDNGSGDAPSIESTPQVTPTIVYEPNNRGYAAGVNVAIRRALAQGADYILVANSDVVFGPDCLHKLLSVASQRPNAGVLGPVVLVEGTDSRIESAGQGFNPWTGRHRLLHQNGRFNRLRGPQSVDAVSGCAWLLTRAAIEFVGLLDENYFLYFEDLDWCIRARQAGFEVLVVPSAYVWHRSGSSIGTDSPLVTSYSVRNHLRVVGRYGRKPLSQALGPIVVGYHAAYLMKNRRLRTRAHVSALFRGVWAACRRSIGP